MNPFAVLGLGAFSALVYGAITWSGSLDAFLNTPSILFVPVATLALLVACHGLRNTTRCLFGGAQRMLLPTTSAPWSPSECHRASQVASTGSSLALFLGALGALSGIILLARHLDDPTQIGPAMAVALLSVLYGVALNLLIFLPLSRHFTDAARRAPADTEARAP